MKEIYGFKKLREHYDRGDISKSYEKLRFSNLPGQIEHLIEINLINSIIKKEKPKLVLEIATGPGRLTKDIKLWSKGIGIDSSNNMLRLAKKNLNNSNWKFMKADVLKMPFKRNYFDMIISFKLIMHFNDKERENAYKEIRRILKKNSYFLFDIGNKKYTKPNLIKFLLKVYRFFFKIREDNKLLPPIHNALITRDELIKELKRNKFSIVKIYGLFYHTNLVLFLLAVSKRIKFFSLFIKNYILRLENSKQKYIERYGSFIVLAKNETN